MPSIPSPIRGWIKEWVTGVGSSVVSEQAETTLSVIPSGDTTRVQTNETRTVSGDYTVDGTLDVNGSVGVVGGDLNGAGDITGSGEIVGT